MTVLSSYLYTGVVAHESHTCTHTHCADVIIIHFNSKCLQSDEVFWRGSHLFPTRSPTPQLLPVHLSAEKSFWRLR